MNLRIIGPSFNILCQAPKVEFDAVLQRLDVEGADRNFSFQCVKLRHVDSIRISFSALTPLNSGAGQAPEEVILDFYF